MGILASRDGELRGRCIISMYSTARSFGTMHESVTYRSRCPGPVVDLLIGARAKLKHFQIFIIILLFIIHLLIGFRSEGENPELVRKSASERMLLGIVARKGLSPFVSLLLP